MIAFYSSDVDAFVQHKKTKKIPFFESWKSSISDKEAFRAYFIGTHLIDMVYSRHNHPDQFVRQFNILKKLLQTHIMDCKTYVLNAIRYLAKDTITTWSVRHNLSKDFPTLPDEVCQKMFREFVDVDGLSKSFEDFLKTPTPEEYMDSQQHLRNFTLSKINDIHKYIFPMSFS